MTRVIPKAEVIKNNQKKNLWLLIHDDVYDVTKFLEEHPGGEDTLLEAAGSDATQAFEDVGHSEDARELLRKYKIGTLPDEEKAAHKKTPASANPCTPKSSKRTLPSCTKTKTPIDSAHTMTKKEHDRNHNSVSGKSSCSGCNSVESCLEANRPTAKKSGKIWRKFDNTNESSDLTSKSSKSTRFVVPPEKCQETPTTTRAPKKIVADPNSPVQSNKKNKKGYPQAKARQRRPSLPCDRCDGGSNWKWYALAALLIGALAVGAMVVKKNS